MRLLLLTVAFLVGCSPPGGDAPDRENDRTRTIRQAVDGGADMNTPPNAVDDVVEVDEDSSTTIDVLANDDDADGDELTVFLVETAREGALTPTGNGTFDYRPRADFSGDDSFTYRVLDGMGGEATAMVSITVLPVNDPPVFVPPTPPDMTTITVTANDTVEFQMAASDVDDDPLEFGFEPFDTISEPATVDDGIFSWTPTRFDLGVTFVRVFVTDGTARDERELTIEIVEPADQVCGMYRCNGSDVCFAEECFPSCQISSHCGGDTGCFDGRCATTACDGVTCQEGEACFGGTCFADCEVDADCAPGERCRGGRCAESACGGITCEAGHLCVGGSCRTECETDGDCVDAKCFDGGCAAGPCQGVVCPVSQDCVSGECISEDEAVVICSDDPEACSEGEPRFEESGCGCNATGGPGSLILVFPLFWIRRRPERTAGP